MKKKSIEDLVGEYRRNAVINGDATEAGNSKTVNKTHDEIIKTLAAIKEYGDLGRAALAKLMDDDNENVVCWAATHSLEYATAKAVRALEELMKTRGIISFDAKMILTEWRAGRL